jgi:hypothetical protein
MVKLFYKWSESPFINGRNSIWVECYFCPYKDEKTIPRDEFGMG